MSQVTGGQVQSRREARCRRLFPVGLYGLLLVSVFGLFFEPLLATPESWLRTVVSLPLRAYSIVWSPPPAYAATSATAASITTLRRELRRRLEQTALAGGLSPGDGYRPRVHAVVGRQRGPAGQLVLAAGPEDVQNSHPMVTAGDRLLGFLAWDREAGAAVVRLLSHTPQASRYRGRPGETILVQAPPLPRRVPARIHLADQQVLRCLVEPARPIDDWPLRCAHVEDPYLASRLRSSGQAVTTDQAEDPQGALPPGLRIGSLKIWGYPDRDIPIGLYVEPAQAPEAVCVVVLWHRHDGDRQRPRTESIIAADVAGQPVRWMQLPAPGGPRWLVTAGSGVRLCQGAALVQDGVLLGTLQNPWSGQSLVLPFDADDRTWSVVLLPEPGIGELGVRELCVQIVHRDGAELTLAVTAREVPAAGLPAGYLFTGANGPDCPLGLFLGAVRPQDGRLLLSREPQTITRPLVYAGEGSRR